MFTIPKAKRFYMTSAISNIVSVLGRSETLSETLRNKNIVLYHSKFLVAYHVGIVECVVASNRRRQRDRESGEAAAATEMTTNPRSGDVYEEINMASLTEPVYSNIEER